MSSSSDMGSNVAQIFYAIYDEARNNLAPYRNVGAATTPYYAGIMGVPGYDKVDPTQALRDTPGYNWLMDQGVEAIDRSAAAKGMMGSGAVGKGLMKFGQGVADQTYNNYMTRLNDLMTKGQTAVTNQGSLGMNMAQGAGNALMEGAKMDDMMEMQQEQEGGLFNDLMGGAGLLAGTLLSSVPGGSMANTVGGKLYNWLKG